MSSFTESLLSPFPSSPFSSSSSSSSSAAATIPGGGTSSSPLGAIAAEDSSPPQNAGMNGSKSGILRTPEGKRRCQLAQESLVVKKITREPEECSSSKISYVSDRVIDLTSARVVLDDNGPSAFKVITPVTSMDFFAENDAERDRWVSEIRKVAEGISASVSAAVSAGAKDGATQSDDDVADKAERSARGLLEEAASCSVCEVLFSPSMKSHICRKCGKYVCDSCSSRRILRIGPMKDEPVRLCDSCYFVLHPDKAALHKLGFHKIGSKHRRVESLSDNQVEEEALKKGYMKKFAGIKGWRSRWFVLRRSTLAYFESEATESKLPLQVIDLSTLIRMNNLSKHPEGFVIVAGDKTVELLTESVAEKTEWMSAIKRSLTALSNPDSPASFVSEGALRPATPDHDRLDIPKENTIRERKNSTRRSTQLLETTASDSDLLGRGESPSINLGEGSKRNSGTIPELNYLDTNLLSDENSEDDLFPEENMSSQVRPGTPTQFGFSEEEYPWTNPTKERQFLSDWALVEDWLQDITTNVKMNNEVVKTEVKKALLRLKRDSVRPFVSLGNDIKKLNDRIVGKKGKKPADEFIGQPQPSSQSTLATPIKETLDETLPAAEVPCGCTDHFENKVMEVLVPARVDKVFDMLYAPKSPFMVQYNQKRGAKDFEEEVQETMKIRSTPDHWKKRNLRYQMYFKNPLTKSPYSLCLENQTLTVVEDGRRYSVDTEVSNPEVIYGDTFDCHSRYCITFVNPNLTRIVCNMKLVWKKQTMLKPMISKLAINAMKEVLQGMGEAILAEVGGPTAPAVTTAALPAAEANPNAPALPGVAPKGVVSQPGPVASAETNPMVVQAAVVGSCILSFLLLGPLISPMFKEQADLALRMAYALRCAVFSSTPLPLILVTGHDLGGDTGLYARLTLFFVLNLVTLSTFQEITEHTNILFLFSLYFLIGSVVLIVLETTKGMRGFNNPGVLLCTTSVGLLLLYNIGLSIFGS